MDQGLLKASPHNRGESHILWVGPNGSDSSPGTYESPLGSIQTAIDRLDDQFSLNDPKHVRVLPGTYEENIVINTTNLRLSGEVQDSRFSFGDSPRVSVVPDDSSLPVITVTDMTKNGLEAFDEDGGISYTASATTPSHSYTGASLARERRFDTSGREMKVTVEGFTMENGSNNPPVLRMLGAPDPDNNNKAELQQVTFLDCVFESDSDPIAYFKNLDQCSIAGTRFLFANQVIFDRCRFTEFASTDRSTVAFIGPVIVAGDANQPADEGGPGNAPTFPSGAAQFDVLRFLDNVGITDDVEASYNSDHRTPFFSVSADAELTVESSNSWGKQRRRVKVEAGEVDFRSSGDINISTLRCDTGRYAGSGRFDVLRLEAQSGNFTISGGSPAIIRGGEVGGDLTINGGADVELRGVTIEGHLDVDSQNTTVHCKGCHVQGDVQQEDVSGSSITFDGGAIMGAVPSPATATYTRNTGS